MIGEVRRSKRINDKEKINYFELARGGTLHTTEGNTVVAQHVTKVHDRDNFESKIITTESSWYRRGVKEALAILKHKPILNEDHGRHPISQIYTIIPEYNTHRTAKVRVGAEVRNTEGNSSTGDEFRNKRRTGERNDTNGVWQNKQMRPAVPVLQQQTGTLFQTNSEDGASTSSEIDQKKVKILLFWPKRV